MFISSQTYFRLNARHEALAVHFDLGLRAYDAGDLSGVRRHLAAVGLLPEAGSACPQFMALQWRALWLDEDRDGALDIARAALGLSPGDPDAAIEVADILVEMEAVEEAAELLLETSEQHESDPELWYEAGVLLESLERWDLRLQCFEHVWELEQDGSSPILTWLSEGRFIEVAGQVIAELPEHVREALGNVVVMVEDYPARWILDTEVADPRLLGLFDGVGRAAEAGHDIIPLGPSRIYLYRWNIERRCASIEEVEEQIAITVLHEIGHYLGLDEDELHARGLG